MTVDLQAFKRWEGAVDAAYRNAGSSLRTSQIRMDVRVNAFESGMTPTAFAALPSPPLLDKPKVGLLMVRGCLWSIAISGGVLLLVLIIGYFLSPVASQSPEFPSPASTVPTASQVPPKLPTVISYEVSAERLARAYKENEVAANAQFTDKLIAVTGVIHSVTDNPVTVELATDSDLRMSFNNVMCEFDSSWRRDIAKLGPGRTIRIVGIVKGSLQGYRPRLVRCSFD
jgi:hypothetical protein